MGGASVESTENEGRPDTDGSVSGTSFRWMHVCMQRSTCVQLYVSHVFCFILCKLSGVAGYLPVFMKTGVIILGNGNMGSFLWVLGFFFNPHLKMGILYNPIE